MRNHTGVRPWQLSGPTGQRATWAPGGSCRFNFGDVPDLTGTNLCNHMLGVLVTAICLVGSSGAQTHAADVDTWLTWLFESAEVRNVWHGTPVSQNHAKGCVMGLMEFLSCGYQYFGRRMSVISVGTHGGKYVKVNAFIPLSYLMGAKGHHTAMPVTFYKNGELQLNFGQGSNDHPPPEGDNTLLSATIMASAVMLPESEIHLGPGNCWIDYPAAVSGGSESVKMDSFGNSTSLQGIEAGAGIDFLGWLSSQYVQGQVFAGAGRVRDLRRFSAPFRGVQSAIHLEPFLAGFEAAIGGRDRGQSDVYDATAMDVQNGTLSGFPYPHNYAGQLVADMAADGEDIRDMLLFPIIYPGHELELTKVATYEGTQSYFLTFASGKAPTSGTHHSFAHQFHSWTPAAWDDALRVVANSGLAQATLGRSTGLGWTPKFSKKNAVPEKIDPAKLRYLPQKVSLLSA